MEVKRGVLEGSLALPTALSAGHGPAALFNDIKKRNTGVRT